MARRRGHKSAARGEKPAGQSEAAPGPAGGRRGRAAAPGSGDASEDQKLLDRSLLPGPPRGGRKRGRGLAGASADGPARKRVARAKAESRSLEADMKEEAEEEEEAVGDGAEARESPGEPGGTRPPERGPAAAADDEASGPGEDEEDSEDDWEEVEELGEPAPGDGARPASPSRALEIEVETPQQAKARERREKTRRELEGHLRRAVQRIQRDVREDTHKVHLLCLLANGLHRSRVCSQPHLLALGLSLVPERFACVPAADADAAFLSRLTQWFLAAFPLNGELPARPGDGLEATLEGRFAVRAARDHEERVHMFLLVLRALQLAARLVLSLQPVPLKPPAQGKKTSKARPTQEAGGPGNRPSGPGGKRKSKSKKTGGLEPPASSQGVEAGRGGRGGRRLRRAAASTASYREQSGSEDEEDKAGSGSDGEAGAEAGAEAGPPRRPAGVDQWLEVFLAREGAWLSVDCVGGAVGRPAACARLATRPLLRAVAFEGAGRARDVSPRYRPAGAPAARRPDPAWWAAALRPLRGPDSDRLRREDLEFREKEQAQPLPTAVGLYKNHPLFALRRHLRKFEAIYPDSAAVLGHCRGEPVYSRDCVHTLHSRDTWLKKGRVVRLGEAPYKMVRGHSNRARRARRAQPQLQDRGDLGLFGRWQTEPYQPPVAVGGKVPRNEFGNVYLFQPGMLPVGCVHLHLPGLQRVARRLGVDCAAAVTGFDFHGGYSHPVTDGHVVCEEFRDLLLSAWESEQARAEQRERERRARRALAHWKLLVRGLLIRERLRLRYGPQSEAAPAAGAGLSSDEEEATSSQAEAARALAASWPRNREAEEKQERRPVRKTRRETRAEASQLFPFEKL
ncbi:DNA repair protein complementing XP-C cells [Microcebus murinus]|uniref:DNA repair protein complementing XP-C cells n=1 Tax=Microcebus murinus TaxID=30608 RepID=UPI003F6B4F61